MIVTTASKMTTMRIITSIVVVQLSYLCGLYDVQPVIVLLILIRIKNGK